jgi:manganese transport protein
MKKIFQLTLGIMASLGGFVDIGELVFTVKAGAIFGYQLLWAIVIGTIGIIVFAEMSGRVAAVVHQPVFTLVRNRLGFKVGLFTLIASNLVNIITCAAEIGGVAILIRLLTGWSYPVLIVGVTLTLIAIIALLPFKWIERFFGFTGVLMIAFVIFALALHVEWQQFAKGLVPLSAKPTNPVLYAYFMVGIFSSLMMPYEVYFYSSGGIEEGWRKQDIPTNKLIANAGFSLGAIVAFALIIVGAQVFLPAGVQPDLVGTSALPGAVAFGKPGLILALLGMIFSVAGAAVETCLAGAYNFAQFFHYRWGRHFAPREAPWFTVTWIVILLLAAGILVSGIDPVQLVEYSVIFAVIVLPLTYLAIMVMAQDKTQMGAHRNSRIDNVLGWTFFMIVCLAAVAAIPLMILTRKGNI